MAYNREYTLQDVVDILNASENRPRPDMATGTGPRGHAISMHSNERKDKFDRPGQNIPTRDSTFLVDKYSLATMVHEALNSPTGQRELAKLNQSSTKSVRFSSVVLRRGKDFDIFTVYRPKEGQSYFDWLSVTKGDGYIVEVFVYVVKVPGPSQDEIHVQTAFAKDFARTDGDLIVRPRSS
jgi:hypothetical protein